jgi:hypothetical protein
MTHDVEPALSEPNSIAPMAMDVNLWEIDLKNLRSGERMDFSVVCPLVTSGSADADERAEPGPTMLVRRDAPKSRAGRVFGVMTLMAIVAVLGIAGFRGRSTLKHAFASATARTRVAQTTMTTAAPPSPPPPVVQAPAPPPAAPTPVAAAPAAAPQPAAATPSSPPTLSTSDLPNAKPAKKKRAGKRTAK